VLDVLALLLATHLQSDDHLGFALLIQTCSYAIEAAPRDLDKMKFQRKITAVSALAALTFNPRCSGVFFFASTSAYAPSRHSMGWEIPPEAAGDPFPKSRCAGRSRLVLATPGAANALLDTCFWNRPLIEGLAWGPTVGPRCCRSTWLCRMTGQRAKRTLALPHPVARLRHIRDIRALHLTGLGRDVDG
jgi:hypothetical protein